MTYIGSVRDVEKAMSDERRIDCPEGVEDFSAPQHVVEAFKRWNAEERRLLGSTNVARMSLGQALGVAPVALREVPPSAMPVPPMTMPVPTIPQHAAKAAAARIAALEAELAAARAALAAAADQARYLTGQKPEAAPAPLAGALRAWSGCGGIDQLTGKPNWV